MPFWENLPYTNFHGVNQDWIINQTKHLVEEWAEYGDNLQQAYDAFTASVNDQIGDLNGDWTEYKDQMNTAFDGLHDYVYDYFDNLDVQDEIDNKLDEMTADHLWDAILQSFFNSYTETIDNKVANQDVIIENQTEAVDLLRAEMNTFLQTHGTVSATLRTFDNLWTGSDYQGEDNIQLSGLLEDYDLIEVRFQYFGQAELEYFTPAKFFSTYGVSVRSTNLTNNTAISPAELWVGECNIKAYDHEDGVTYTYDTVLFGFSHWKWDGDHLADSVQTLTNTNFRITQINGIKYTDISATTDAELTDIRVGYDGTVYPTAGNAVREQIESVINSTMINHEPADTDSDLNRITEPGYYFLPAANTYTHNPASTPATLEVISVDTDDNRKQVTQKVYEGNVVHIRQSLMSGTIMTGAWKSITAV